MMIFSIKIFIFECFLLFTIPMFSSKIPFFHQNPFSLVLEPFLRFSAENTPKKVLIFPVSFSEKSDQNHVLEWFVLWKHIGNISRKLSGKVLGFSGVITCGNIPKKGSLIWPIKIGRPLGRPFSKPPKNRQKHEKGAYFPCIFSWFLRFLGGSKITVFWVFGFSLLF